MNVYVNMINETVEYIEENINQKITLEGIAAKFCVSKFHFNRMFKTVAGMTLKQYILGRKLTQALNYLIETNKSVIDTAYDFSFEYPEVFSRAFKKQFGVSPSDCKGKKIDNNNLVEKANVVERDIVNYKGTLTLRGTYEYLDELSLQGIYIEVDINSKEFETELKTAGDEFWEKSQELNQLKSERLYVAINCHEKDNGEYTAFYGMEYGINDGIIDKTDKETNFTNRIIPKGWYAKFIYYGNMFDIRETFVDDLYRWIIIKEVELNQCGLGMLNIFGKDYLETGEVQILVPIKEPR